MNVTFLPCNLQLLKIRDAGPSFDEIPPFTSTITVSGTFRIVVSALFFLHRSHVFYFLKLRIFLAANIFNFLIVPPRWNSFSSQKKL